MTRGLATYADAIEWLSEHWTPREIPLRLHTVQSEGWGLFYTVPFRRDVLDACIDDKELLSESRMCQHFRNATQNVWDCPDCHGLGVYETRSERYKWPMWRAICQLSAFDRGHPPRPGLPGLTACIYLLVLNQFDGHRAALTCVNSTKRGAWEVAEPIFLMAIRYLWQRYTVQPPERRRTSWVDKSEAQQNAEVAA